MSEIKQISALVVGGEASAGPPLGPALGPLGVNVLAIVKEINEKTKDYTGMRVPAKITVDLETKQFQVEVGTPTTSALIVKEAGIQKGSGKPNIELVGNLSIEQVIGIAEAKFSQSYATTLNSAAREIIGSCVSLGIKVEGEDPRNALQHLREGKWNEKFHRE